MFLECLSLMMKCAYGDSLWSLPATVQGLPLFPFLDGNHVINGLITELPNYVAKAHNFIMACEEDKVNWWRQHSDRSPHWSFAVMKVILVQPSSAAAERVFSIINSSFNDSQDHALVDYIQACVMLQYNKRLISVLLCILTLT